MNESLKSPQASTQQTPNNTALTLEDAIKNTVGLSHIGRTSRVTEDGEKKVIWQAVGSWGRGGRVSEGETLRDALVNLSKEPYHLDPELGRRQQLSEKPSSIDLLARAIGLDKSDDELLDLAGVDDIKNNWEERQPIPRDEAWSVYYGTTRKKDVCHANTLRDALCKAYITSLGIKVLGEDEHYVYLENFLPAYGEEHRGVHAELQTKVPKQEIQNILQGKKAFEKEPTGE